MIKAIKQLHGWFQHTQKHMINKQKWINSKEKLTDVALNWVICWGGLSIPTGEGNGTPLQYSCLENPLDRGAWWAAVYGVEQSRTWMSDFTFTFQFHAVEKEMATHSSVLAWRIPGTGEPGRLPSTGSHRVGHDWSDWALAYFIGHLNLQKFPTSETVSHTFMSLYILA